jgi:hypothetical protein
VADDHAWGAERDDASSRPETRRDVLIAPPPPRDRIRGTRFDSRNHPNLLIPTPPNYRWRTRFRVSPRFPTSTPTPFRGYCGICPSSTCVGSVDASALPDVGTLARGTVCVLRRLVRALTWPGAPTRSSRRRSLGSRPCRAFGCLQFAFGLLRAVAVVELDVLEVLPLENERPEFVGGLGRAGRPERDTFVLWRQLPTSKLVGLSVGLPSFALPARKPHAPDFLIRGFLRWLPCRESEGLVRCPLTPGLADGQPVPPTACGPMGRIFASIRSHIKFTRFLPRLSRGLPRCYRCEVPRTRWPVASPWSLAQGQRNDQ